MFVGEKRRTKKHFFFAKLKYENVIPLNVDDDIKNGRQHAAVIVGVHV